jgi:protein TonB
MQPVELSHRDRGLLKPLQHWGPVVLLSIILNVGLLHLFVLLIAMHEPVATEKSRLHVRLLQNTSQEPIAPPKPAPPKPVKKPPEPKPKVVHKTQPEKPKPVVKPPPPKQIVKANKPPPQPDTPEESPEAPVEPAEDLNEEPVNVQEAKPALLATSQPIPSQAPTVAEIVPLFRLTKMPKVVDYNLETLKRFYPEEERGFGKEATVEAMILVDENGKIVEIEIIKSAGARFDAAAKKALLSNALEIQPGYIGDKPVASRVSIPITFNLTN